jgi:hypothetical protein
VKGRLSFGTTELNPLIQTLHDVSKAKELRSREIPLPILHSKGALKHETLAT